MESEQVKKENKNESMLRESLGPFQGSYPCSFIGKGGGGGRKLESTHGTVCNIDQQ